MKILIVDDNRESAQTMGWMLELFGHDVCQAHDGQEALHTAARAVPDIVLMDIGLPGMNGYEACKRMQALPGMEKTVFVAQTGWGGAQHEKLSRDAGFVHHLVKPVDMDTLQGLLPRRAAASNVHRLDRSTR